MTTEKKENKKNKQNKYSSKLNKRQFICKALGHGQKKVHIKKDIKDPSELSVDVPPTFKNSRQSGVNGIILGFVHATFGLYYYILVNKEIRVYHIDEFIIIK